MEVIIEVVVVLPCVPETPMEFLYFLKIIPSMTLRSIIGIFCSFAAIISGLLSLIAAENTTKSCPEIFSFTCSVLTFIPSFLTFSKVSDSYMSEPLTENPFSCKMEAKGNIPEPPIPMKYILFIFSKVSILLLSIIFTPLLIF